MKRLFPVGLSLLIVLLIFMMPYASLVSSEFRAQVDLTRLMAITTDRDGNQEIYVMNSDGSNPVNLTRYAGNDWHPSWSPDGGQIAFNTDRDGRWQIYVMNIDGSHQMNLIDDPANLSGPAWSPDGNYIAFASDHAGGWDIYVWDIEHSFIQRVTSTGSNKADPAWSPDGKRIAFWQETNGNNQVYIVNVDGSDLHPLTDNHAQNGWVDWSPSGHFIAFDTNRDGNWEVYLMNPDGSLPINLTYNDSMDGRPSWSPDSQQIAFISNRDGNNEIYIMDADGNHVRCLTNNPADDSSVAWQPTSNRAVAGTAAASAYVSVSETVTPDKATFVALPDGAAIVIPAGALTSQATVTVEANPPKIADLPPFDQGTVPVGDFYNFTVTAAELTAPVNLVLPFNPQAIPDKPGSLVVAFPGKAGWEYVPVIAEGNRIVLQTLDPGDPLLMWDFEEHPTPSDRAHQSATLCPVEMSVSPTHGRMNTIFHVTGRLVPMQGELLKELLTGIGVYDSNRIPAVLVDHMPIDVSLYLGDSDATPVTTISSDASGAFSFDVDPNVARLHGPRFDLESEYSEVEVEATTQGCRFADDFTQLALEQSLNEGSQDQRAAVARLLVNTGYVSFKLAGPAYKGIVPIYSASEDAATGSIIVNPEVPVTSQWCTSLDSEMSLGGVGVVEAGVWGSVLKMGDACLPTNHAVYQTDLEWACPDLNWRLAIPEKPCSANGQSGEPNASATAEASQPTQADATVNTKSLNVRLQPGAGNVRKAVPWGTEVHIVGRVRDNSWVKVVAPDGTEGWAFTQLLHLNIDLNTVQVLDVEVIGQQEPAPPQPGQPPPVSEPEYRSFYAIPNAFNEGGCTDLHWDVRGIREVYYQGLPTVGQWSAHECPTETTTYVLHVVRLDGSSFDLTAAVIVNHNPPPPPPPSSILVYTCGGIDSRGLCTAPKAVGSVTCSELMQETGGVATYDGDGNLIVFADDPGCNPWVYHRDYMSCPNPKPVTVVTMDYCFGSQ